MKLACPECEQIYIASQVRRPNRVTGRFEREGCPIASHLITTSGDRWPDNTRLSDLEPRFVCSACGKRGADVRPDFNWNKPAVPMMGYR